MTLCDLCYDCYNEVREVAFRVEQHRVGGEIKLDLCAKCVNKLDDGVRQLIASLRASALDSVVGLSLTREQTAKVEAFHKSRPAGA